MFASAQIQPVKSGPGPDIFWFIPIAGLWLFGFAILFLMEPLYALYGLMLALVSVALRQAIPGPAKFAIAAMPALIATMAVLASIVLAADLHKRMTAKQLPETISHETDGPQFGFHGMTPQRPLYELAIRKMFVRKNDAQAGVPYPSRINPDLFDQVSGHVLIKSFDWERSSDINAAVGCDARCQMLLRNPNVASVTIEPDRSLFWEGPRAILPGLRPIPMTYSLKENARCDANWHDDAAEPETELSSFGDALRSQRHRAKVISWCLLSSSGQQSIYDYIFRGDEFWAR